MPRLDEIAQLGDVPIELDVELDRKVMTIEAILQLAQGSVVRMDSSAGENIDIIIGGSLVAFGEIVIIEDAVGVRITDFNTEE